MIRSSTAPPSPSRRRAPLLALAAVAALCVAAVGRARAQEAGPLERYDSKAHEESAAHERSTAAAARGSALRFAVGVPAGWLAKSWGGARTRFFPPDAEGPHSAMTYFEVNLVPKDEPLPEGRLLEPGGLSKWVEEALPRYETEDQRRVKVGRAAASCDALLVKDPARKITPDRRELIVLVPAEAGAYLLRFSAPLKEYASRDALWKKVLESFEAQP